MINFGLDVMGLKLSDQDDIQFECVNFKVKMNMFFSVNVLYVKLVGQYKMWFEYTDYVVGMCMSIWLEREFVLG